MQILRILVPKPSNPKGLLPLDDHLHSESLQKWAGPRTERDASSASHSRESGRRHVCRFATPILHPRAFQARHDVDRGRPLPVPIASPTSVCGGLAGRLSILSQRTPHHRRYASGQDHRCPARVVHHVLQRCVNSAFVQPERRLSLLRLLRPRTLVPSVLVHRFD